MSTYSLKRFTQPEAIHSIDSKCLLDLLVPHRAFFSGRELELPSSTAQLNYPALIEILATPGPDTPKELADALYFINELSTAEGMDELLKEVPLLARAFGEPAMTPADVAVRAWLFDRRVVERKHAELAATNPRRFEYFQTLADPVPTLGVPNDKVLTGMEASLDLVFAKRRRGRARVFAYPRGTDWLFMVRHGDPYRREGTLNGHETSCVLYQPLRFDVVVYDCKAGMLGVHARTQWETSLYRQEFGRHLFGELDFFSSQTRYTLAPLRTAGRASLVCSDVPELRLITLTEVELRIGGVNDEYRVIRAQDVFSVLAREPLPETPTITRATFLVHMRDAHDIRTVSIQPPNVAHYSRDDDGVAIGAWLALRGFVSEPVQRTHEPTLPLMSCA